MTKSSTIDTIDATFNKCHAHLNKFDASLNKTCDNKCVNDYGYTNDGCNNKECVDDNGAKVKDDIYDNTGRDDNG